MLSQNLDCQICCFPFNQDERVPKICPCGHTLCLHCLTQHFSHQSKCPFCRFNMNTFNHNPNLVTTNRALMELLDDKCSLHSELRTLLCLTCKHETCSACVYLDQSHSHHKIIHKNQIFHEKKETKERLWLALDRQRKFSNAMTLLLRHTKKIAMNKLEKLKDNVDKKLEESIIQETHQFFAVEEEKIEETIKKDEDSIQLIQEQLATLDNPRIDEEVLEALGKEPAELGAEKQHELLLNDIIKFNEFLDQTIELTLLLGSIQTSQAAADSSFIISDERVFFNIRKLLNFDFQCDTLVVSQKTANTEVNEDALSTVLPRSRAVDDSDQIFIPFKSTESPREIAGITIRILDLLRRESHAVKDFLSQKIDITTPLSLWSLKFWLQGVIVFEINLCGCQIRDEELGSLFRNVMPKLTTLQEITLDFKEANLEDGVLQTFEKNTLSNLKNLQVFKFNADGTRVTNRGITYVLKRIIETGQSFSVVFGSEKIFSKDLASFIQSTLTDDKGFAGLTTSFDVYILKEDQPECLSIDQLSRQIEGNSTGLSLLNDENELAMGIEFMCERQVSEYVRPSEESRYKLIILKLSSQQDKSVNNSGVSTGNFEVQPESTRLEKENL